MIKIIAAVTYGYHNGKTVERKTKNSAPFSLSDDAERDLVNRGIAEYVDNPAYSGGMSLAYLKSLKMAQLKDIADDMGIKYKVGTKKEDFAEMLYAEISKDEPADTVPFNGMFDYE